MNGLITIHIQNNLIKRKPLCRGVVLVNTHNSNDGHTQMTHILDARASNDVSTQNDIHTQMTYLLEA